MSKTSVSCPAVQPTANMPLPVTTTCIRIDFHHDNVKKAKTVPSALYEIIKEWTEMYPTMTITGYDDKVTISPTVWPKEDTFDTTFNLRHYKGRLLHSVVVFNIRSLILFGEIKDSVWSTLKHHQGWINCHPQTFESSNIVSGGWLLHVHPRFHAKARIHDTLTKSVENEFPFLKDAEKEHYFKLLNDPNANTAAVPKLPPIKLVPTTASATNEQVLVAKIQAEKRVANATKYLLDVIYKSSDTKGFMFVDYNWKKDHPEMYLSLIQDQHEFLTNHRNIPLAGIPEGWWKMQTHWQDKMTTPEKIVQSLEGIKGIDKTNCTHDLGKFNISTTAEHYNKLCKWFNLYLPVIFAGLPKVPKMTASDFPLPVRMGSQSAKALTSFQYESRSRSKISLTHNDLSKFKPAMTKQKTNSWINCPFKMNYDVSPIPTMNPTPSPTNRKTYSNVAAGCSYGAAYYAKTNQYRYGNRYPPLPNSPCQQPFPLLLSR